MAVVVAETPTPCPWLLQLECLLLFELKVSGHKWSLEMNIFLLPAFEKLSYILLGFQGASFQ